MTTTAPSSPALRLGVLVLTVATAGIHLYLGLSPPASRSSSSTASDTSCSSPPSTCPSPGCAPLPKRRSVAPRRVRGPHHPPLAPHNRRQQYHYRVYRQDGRVATHHPAGRRSPRQQIGTRRQTAGSWPLRAPRPPTASLRTAPSVPPRGLPRAQARPQASTWTATGGNQGRERSGKPRARSAAGSSAGSGEMA